MNRDSHLRNLSSVGQHIVNRKTALMMLFLWLSLVFTHTLHADKLENQVEHYQCQLCQSNIDLPTLTLEPLVQTKIVNFLYKVNDIYVVFSADKFHTPPLRAPPIF